VADLLSSQPDWRDRLSHVRRVPTAVLMGAGAVAVAVVLAAFLLLRDSPPPPALQLPRAEAAPATTETTTGVLVVDVAGAVVRPGLLRLQAGARVADLVAAAGGPTPDADLDQVNLAARAADGDRVYIPRRGETPPPAVSGSGPAARTGPVDLNSATVEQLDALPGVGPATAQAILEWRRQHGRFRSVQDLLEVRGIGPAKFATLRPLVKT